MESGKLVFNSPFEIIMARWNSSAHQSNQNHNGKFSKVVPVTFKIHRKLYNKERINNVAFGRGDEAGGSNTVVCSRKR